MFLINLINVERVNRLESSVYDMAISKNDHLLPGSSKGSKGNIGKMTALLLTSAMMVGTGIFTTLGAAIALLTKENQKMVEKVYNKKVEILKNILFNLVLN